MPFYCSSVLNREVLIREVCFNGNNGSDDNISCPYYRGVRQKRGFTEHIVLIIRSLTCEPVKGPDSAYSCSVVKEQIF